MTMVADPSASPSLKGSSVSEWDFSALGEAQPSDAPEPESTDATPESHTCPTCQLPVTRVPGQRGKLGKYHPDCKPTARQRITGSATASRAGNPKAAREADEVIAMLKPKMMQAAMMLAAIDRFDAFVFLNGITPLCSSLHGVLVRYDSFRKDALAMKAGGSVFGLIFTAVMMALPILAHHGLIPGAKLQEMLIQFPVMMFKLSQRMKEGEQALTDMMNRVAEEMLRPKNGAKANDASESTGETAGPS